MSGVRRLLVFIAEQDRREAWRTDGARSMADWVAYRLGYSDRSARDMVATAKALEFLPAIADCLRAGLLTPEKVRWLATFATIDEDVSLANDATGMSAHEVRKLALERLRVTREMAEARLRLRYVRFQRDREAGLVRGSFCLPDAEGEVVVRAIERAAKNAPIDSAPSFEARRADALVQICSLALGADADPDRATVVVHVDGGVSARLEGGTPVADATVRRMSCDGRLQTVVHTEGNLAASPTKRTCRRTCTGSCGSGDGTCTFPGCSNDIWVHAHHVQHFADGGPTTLDNLVLLCRAHHRLVHEGGWCMTAAGEFVRPDGTPLRRYAPLRQ